MFGYIRPYLPDLKVKELEQFRACYCGLCHTLKCEYGQASRFVLNYDFTFLAMLLWDESSPFRTEKKACIVSPFKKKYVCPTNDALDLCAGLSVILAYWKECDTVVDEGFPAADKARAAKLALKSAYKKAAKKYSAFDSYVKERLSELSKLEKNGEQSLDKAADRFASILSYIGEEAGREDDRRILSQLLYHTGRFIYIADAFCDIEDDIKKGRYNPIVSRLSLKSPEQMSDEDKEVIKISLFTSQRLMASAFQLMERTCWTDILSNIIYVGIPDIGEKVLNGTFENVRESKRIL